MNGVRRNRTQPMGAHSRTRPNGRIIGGKSPAAETISRPEKKLTPREQARAVFEFRYLKIPEKIEKLNVSVSIGDIKRVRKGISEGIEETVSLLDFMSPEEMEKAEKKIKKGDVKKQNYDFTLHILPDSCKSIYNKSVIALFKKGAIIDLAKLDENVLVEQAAFHHEDEFIAKCALRILVRTWELPENTDKREAILQLLYTNGMVEELADMGEKEFLAKAAFHHEEKKVAVAAAKLIIKNYGENEILEFLSMSQYAEVKQLSEVRYDVRKRGTSQDPYSFED